VDRLPCLVLLCIYKFITNTRLREISKPFYLGNPRVSREANSGLPLQAVHKWSWTSTPRDLKMSIPNHGLHNESMSSPNREIEADIDWLLVTQTKAGVGAFCIGFGWLRLIHQLIDGKHPISIIYRLSTIPGGSGFHPVKYPGPQDPRTPGLGSERIAHRPGEFGCRR